MTSFPIETTSPASRQPPDRFLVELEESWAAGGLFTAGYLQSLAARAALKATVHPHPIVVSTNFLEIARIGPAELEVEYLQRTRDRDVIRCDMIQNGTIAFSSTIVVGTLQASGSDIDRCRPLDLPPPDRCTVVDGDAPLHARHGVFDHVELRLAPECTGMLHGSADGSFLLRGWLHMATDLASDPTACLVAVDAFPPVTVTIGRYTWPPVIQMTTYMRALPRDGRNSPGNPHPAPGWFRGEKRGRLLAGGWLDEDCAMRDGSGAIVAQARRFLALH